MLWLDRNGIKANRLQCIILKQPISISLAAST